MADERGDEGRLADPRWAGDADRSRSPRRRVEVADDARREGVAVLHERDGTGQRAPIAVADPCDEALARPVPSLRH